MLMRYPPKNSRAMSRLGVWATSVSMLLILGATGWAADATVTIDLLDSANATNAITRVHGADNIGDAGVPVFGGNDVDGDGNPDYGICGFRSSPLGRSNAGGLSVVFGGGALGAPVSTHGFSSNILKIAGAGVNEYCGSEAWMDDVTGDGLGDVLICRQAADYDDNGTNRNAAGALTILVGGPELRTHAETLAYLDLANIPTNITAISFYGTDTSTRMGIWVRTGDVDGDGTNDLAVGEDQNDFISTHGGAVYVIRGGTHLVTNLVVDMKFFPSSPVGDHIARLYPHNDASEYHFGSTVAIGDLDGDGKGEVMASAALARSGASFGDGEAHGSGGAPFGGRMFIAWGSNFTPTLWTNGYEFQVNGSAPADYSIILGAGQVYLSDGTKSTNSVSSKFGEEMLAGRDYDGDGSGDLFIGDITGKSKNRVNSGMGWIFWNVEITKNNPVQLGVLGTIPTNLEYTVIYGPGAHAISSDTAAHGDFNDDGIDDLLIGSPCDDPPGRSGAGTMHIFYGQTNTWPLEIDLVSTNLPDPSVLKVYEFLGVKTGDILCYSAADGDVTGDGVSDIIVNEMKGDNPINASSNAGNLLLIDGALLSQAVDLSLEKQVSENPLSTSTQFMYFITASNAGPATAENVMVFDDAPAGLDIATNAFQSATGTVAGVTSIVWSIPSIAVGQVVTGVYTVSVSPTTPFVITNAARVDLFGLDYFSSNDVDEVMLTLLNSDADGLANVVDPDDDNDDIPDEWEIANGLNSTNNADAGADEDVDGRSAFEEYVSDTNPFDSNSVFAVASIMESSSTYTVTWDSRSNRFYDIYCATNLSSNSWSAVLENIPGDGTSLSRVLTNATAAAFYWIQVDLTP